ncbi:MAG: succinylarginine dihydrolase [Hydrocarboniphaga sp.]|uniref:N-succinylarginine dihydrolase n=1 Tax=Hydrocarboniphaga sp. TaxID=2033016 RepID=UPI00262D2C58|nr:N-succinylarginine dihydrolase [Hydrocarboniphaga sp.]MDB5967895.1 succinylarginine dihydrolase [Hydrocarboniphaga sp.]
MNLESNFDGLVGPTHNYSGLARGNLAAAKNADLPSNPRAAALQGLAKMRALHDIGLPQGVLPPQERPNVHALRRLGYSGHDRAVLDKVSREAPGLLAAVSSASSMWTANAGTVSPSADTLDGRVHFTPANLCSNLHRSFEPETSGRVLAATFRDPQYFAHHEALPATPAMSDEGAANHTRLCSEYGEAGLELFVYGRGGPDEPTPTTFPARQTRAACEALARLHELAPERTRHQLQNPAVIDAGVFHNDVIAVGNREVLLYHQDAFADTDGLRLWIQTQWRGSRAPVFLEVPRERVSVEEAVSSYLFNSQLICPPGGGMHLVVSSECQEQPRVWAEIQQLLADERNPLTQVQVFDLRQSMRNGGGPACLRLRVVLTEAERAAVNPQSWLTPERHGELVAWVKQHYRDRLVLKDLADPQLLDESRTALDRLTQILGLGSVYQFQR